MADTRASEETVGQRLRRLRLARKLSQRELSEPGVSYPYISRIESGNRQPSLRAIRVLAPKLGVTPEYLETGETVPPAAQRELQVADAELELRAGRDLDKAEAVFRRAADAAQDGGSAAQAKAGLGLIAARRNEPHAAIPLLETAIDHLTPEARPDVYDALGEMYVAVGTGGRAVTLFESCLTRVRERAPDDATLQTRFAVLLAAAHSAVGALERARDALHEATDAASEQPIPLSRVRVYWMEAIEAWQDGDSGAALGSIRRAIGLLEAEDNTLQVARAHVIAGRMLTLDGRYDEARVHLQRADRLFTLGSTPVDLGILRAEDAKLAAHQDDPDAALALADEAAKLIGDDARYRSNVAHAYAMAHQAAGNPDEAEAHYRAALEALSGARQWRENAAAARELSRLLRSRGRDAEAYELLDRAAVLAIRHVGGVQRRTRSRAETDE